MVDIFEVADSALRNTLGRALQEIMGVYASQAFSGVDLALNAR